uniref:Uncharacterized protein n=1 Tax=Timema monikensis TaxID=170555 RepID=A0A7R9HLH7_9NEOP|nr:unnamed protein product [Timema monikensis]
MLLEGEHESKFQHVPTNWSHRVVSESRRRVVAFREVLEQRKHIVNIGGGKQKSYVRRHYSMGENLSEQGLRTSMAPFRVNDVFLKPLDMRIGGTVKFVVEGLRQLPEVVLHGRQIRSRCRVSFRTYQGAPTMILRHTLWNACILIRVLQMAPSGTRIVEDQPVQLLVQTDVFGEGLHPDTKRGGEVAKLRKMTTSARRWRGKQRETALPFHRSGACEGDVFLLILQQQSVGVLSRLFTGTCLGEDTYNLLEEPRFRPLVRWRRQICGCELSVSTKEAMGLL